MSASLLLAAALLCRQPAEQWRPPLLLALARRVDGALVLRRVECETWRLPGYDDALRAAEAAAVHCEWVSRRRWTDSAASGAAWAEWADDACHLYRCWDTLTRVRSTERGWTGWDRRGAADELRRLIGEDAYRRQEMPPSLPWWRFADG